MATTSMGRIQHRALKHHFLTSRIMMSRSQSTTATVPLHVGAVGDGSITEGSTVFVHGLLGNGRNLKTFAKQVCKVTNAPGYLLDLRGHGKSRLTTTSSSTHSFDACVKDVTEATRDLSMTSIVGHSWGGRMALQYAATQNSESLQRVWLLDTIPGQANESVEQVIDAVTRLSTQLSSTSETMDRKQVVAKLLEAGLDTGIAQWLASSFDGRDFGFDLPVANDILPEFATQDFYGLLEQILDNDIRVDLVRGGKNTGWDMGTLRQLEDMQRKHSQNFGMHVLPKAGHWVHVDDLNGLVNLFDTY